MMPRSYARRSSSPTIAVPSPTASRPSRKRFAWDSSGAPTWHPWSRATSRSSCGIALLSCPPQSWSLSHPRSGVRRRPQAFLSPTCSPGKRSPLCHGCRALPALAALLEARACTEHEAASVAPLVAARAAASEQARRPLQPCWQPGRGEGLNTRAMPGCRKATRTRRPFPPSRRPWLLPEAWLWRTQPSLWRWPCPPCWPALPPRRPLLPPKSSRYTRCTAGLVGVTGIEHARPVATWSCGGWDARRPCPCCAEVQRHAFSRRS
jgi:hypothetical protein